MQTPEETLRLIMSWSQYLLGNVFVQACPNWGGWRGYSPPKTSRFKNIDLRLAPPTFCRFKCNSPSNFYYLLAGLDDEGIQ